MAQADAKTIAAEAAKKPHYVLDDIGSTRLHRLGLALMGLSSLAHDGDAETSREEATIAREDLAAIFYLLSEQVDIIRNDMPYTFGSRH